MKVNVVIVYTFLSTVLSTINGSDFINFTNYSGIVIECLFLSVIMSQLRVRDFFSLKKGNSQQQHPAKRRKLGSVGATDDEVIAKRRITGSAFCDESLITTQHNNNSKAETIQEELPKTLFPRSKMPVIKSNSKSQSRIRVRGKAPAKTKGNIDGQKSLMEFVVKKADITKDFLDEREKVLSHSPSKATKLGEEITSFWDDHADQCTPRKRIMSDVDSLSQGPKSRIRKSAVRKLDQDTLPSPHTSDVKKKLDLTPETSVSSEAAENEEGEKTSGVEFQNANEDRCVASPVKKSLLDAVSEMTSIQRALTPLALTPESESEHQPQSPSPDPSSLTPKLQDLSEKLKALSKMDGQALKNRLKKKGMLGDFKEKLQDLSKANVENKKATVVEETPKEKTEGDEVPAFQRYEHLVSEGPPTLSMPYAFRLLDSAFQAMDTVVSMLHNRSEVCTFSKLQASVQTMTKKNFPEKTVGQIKTVVPDAFTFKQERVPVYGQRACPYALTIEANLSPNGGSSGDLAKSGKIPFTASVLLKRKAIFKVSLLNILKKQHKVFLESLSPPMRIPHDKITRWHPKFALDKVPSIIPSPLPKSPDVQVIRSASDVLEMQIGKLNPRVEKALQKVAAASKLCKENASKSQETGNSGNKTPSKIDSQNSSSPQSSSAQSSPSQSSMKGIPPALLAKIRAKEALKIEQALTRNPEEDKKLRMMGHLPEMIRILRSYFVTEKKPALPLDNVIKKLGDSYHTGLSRGDIEQHIKLLREVAPELFSVVEVKKGKFVKLDKNVDITALSNRINNIVKAQK